MHNPSSSVSSVSLEVEPLEDRCVPSTTAFVAGLYTNLLHRSPQAAEVTPWVNALDAGTLTPQQAALNFTTSTEYRTNVIQSDYQKLLGRTASTVEVNNFVAALQNGLSQQQVVVVFLASDEYFNKHGGNNASWLAGVYHDLLGRAPDPSGQATWEALLQRGTSRSQVAQDIAGSPEALARIVAAAYQDVLGRPADAAGLATWTAALQRGTTPEQLLALLATSPEFINARGGLDPVQKVPVPVPVPVPVGVPVDTFVFNPFLGGPFFGFGTPTVGFTGGGTGFGFTGGGTGFGGSGGSGC
jgi:hypothetical protein